MPLVAGAYVNRWTSAAGALEGALQALGSGTSEHEVLAVSGHAFRLAVTSTPDGEVGAGGPCAFPGASAAVLYEGLGWRWRVLECASGREGYDRRRREALDAMRRSVRHGRPAIAFGLHLPEFGLVRGYDERGAQLDLIAGTTMSAQYGERIPAAQWPAPGHALPVRIFVPEKRIDVRPDRAFTRTIAFAVDYARHGEPKAAYAGDVPVTGLAAFERWIEVLEGEEQISPSGQSYCIQALQEARAAAAAYLRSHSREDHDAGQALLVERAATAYREVVVEVSRLATLFPFPNGGDVRSPGLRRAGAAALRRALEAERRAVSLLEELRERL